MNEEIKEIKINKANKSITFINNGIGFSQFGIADEILDLITNLQEENEELKQETEKLTQLWLDSQQKRRKAIEYINKEVIPYGNEWCWDDRYIEDLVINTRNILQNGSDPNDPNK